MHCILEAQLRGGNENQMISTRGPCYSKCFLESVNTNMLILPRPVLPNK
jgi:hypothetical protein